MRSDGKRWSATRRMLTARSATSGAKPSLTSVLKMSAVEQPRWTFCATQSCHSCGKSVRAMHHGQPRRLRVLPEGLVGGEGEGSADELRNDEGRHIPQADAGECRRKATRQSDCRIRERGRRCEPVRGGDIRADRERRCPGALGVDGEDEEDETECGDHLAQPLPRTTAQGGRR